jgi:hypothetical protein
MTPRSAILDVPKAECEPQVQPNSMLYDRQWEPIAAVAER